MRCLGGGEDEPAALPTQPLSPLGAWIFSLQNGGENNYLMGLLQGLHEIMFGKVSANQNLLYNTIVVIHSSTHFPLSHGGSWLTIAPTRGMPLYGSH